MEIIAYRCDDCGFVIENPDNIQKHLDFHIIENGFKKQFPEPDDPGSKWANGEFSIQRDKAWLDSLKNKILDNYKTSFSPWSYGFYRSLDDSGHWLYHWALRVYNTCPTCFREWGQYYYTIKCNHEYLNGIHLPR